MGLLDVKNLTKKFGGLTAVDDVSFSIEENDILGMIGPNGAGKTTLFNCIVNFYPSDYGAVYFKGKDITKFASNKICELGIARTFQIVRILKGMSVIDNVIVGSLLRFSDVKRARSYAIKALEITNLTNKKDINCESLTLADKKRLEIARALATQPKLLILDEVMAGLSPTEAQEAVEIIRKINKMGIAIFMVEHVMEIIMPLSHRVLVLDSGKKIAEGAPKEIVKNPEIIRVYLGE